MPGRDDALPRRRARHRLRPRAGAARRTVLGSPAWHAWWWSAAGSGAPPPRPGWPSSATRSRGRTARPARRRGRLRRAGRLPLGHRPVLDGPARRASATCSASPGGPWSASSTWCRSSRCASTASRTAPCCRCPRAAARPSSTPSTTALGSGAGRAWVDHVHSFAGPWDLLRRGYFERPYSPEHLDQATRALLRTRTTLHKVGAEGVPQGRAAPPARPHPRHDGRPGPAQRARRGSACCTTSSRTSAPGPCPAGWAGWPRR